LPLTNGKDKIVEEWFSASATDLKCAKVLYDNKLFASSLYHLQQSNEKLTKALLLSIGILTPKRAAKDWMTKSVLGFLPKEPSSYRHRVLPSLLSDLEKIAPSLTELMTLPSKSLYGSRVREFGKTIRTSRKRVQKLKKNPPGLIETTEQLEREIKTAQAILARMEQTTDKANQELEKLDPSKMLRAAILIARELGFRVDTSQLGLDIDKIKRAVLSRLQLAILAMLSAAIASFLDPLEPITRYPDSRHPSFDESNPYVKNFNGLYDVISQCLEKSLTTTSKALTHLHSYRYPRASNPRLPTSST
jgi:hypothetical protein